MATRSPRTPPAQPAPPAANLLPWDWGMELARQQMAVAAEGATTLFRGFEAMRGIQEQAAREASEHHANVAGKLRKPCSATEMMAWQTELLRQDFDAATRYWMELAGAAMEMGTELIACSTRLVDTEDFFAPTAARVLHS